MFILEVWNWIEFEPEAEFLSFEEAVNQGRQEFSNNRWRILEDGEVVCEGDPLTTFQHQAYQESARFIRSEDWIDHMLGRPQRNSNRIRQQTYQRLSAIASRQRMTAHPDPTIFWDDDWGEDDLEDEPQLREKVNWLREGF